jgi:hypothetical protein
MRSLSEIVADNDAAVTRAEAKRKASLRRLKQRIANAAWMFTPELGDAVRRKLNKAIDAWDAAEQKRGAR